MSAESASAQKTLAGMTRSSTPVVLGLCAFTHDSAAALLVGGQLVGFVEEERLSGVKHTKDYPEHSVEYLLREAGLGAADVDVVAYNFQASRYFAALAGTPQWLLKPATRSLALPRAAGFARVGARTARRLRDVKGRFPRARVRSILHHRAHQHVAFAASGWDDAAVLIVDSLGETQTTTIGQGRYLQSGAPEIITKSAVHDPASLGFVYGAVTEHLGWRRNDEEGTVMALAALGDPARFRQLFAQAVQFTPRGFTLDPELFSLRTLQPRQARTTAAFAAATCPERTSGEPIENVHQDLAAALQERTDLMMLGLARRSYARTRARRLCVGGGVATNCVSIGRIIKEGIFEEVFVPPAPGDAGTALGAAIAAHAALPGAAPLSGIAGQCYTGPAYTGAGTQSIDLAEWPGLTEETRDLTDDESAAGLSSREGLAELLARRLAEGQIIGLFQGRLEAGPRALGNRSILASPLLPGVVHRLNATVKFREPFRPFAPMVTAERAAEFFTLGQPAPFMSMASGVTDAARERIPSIVHANGTARLQTVTRAHNPFVHQVLTAFGRLTGVPVLINTSLNVKGKPICGTPQMALQCLNDSGLDALLLEGRWITK